MKKINRKIQFTILILIFLVLSGIFLFNKPTEEYNQHPIPALIGTLKFPEYLDGGCTSYDYVEKKDRSDAMTNLPYISRDIALKEIDSSSIFWNRIKEILGDSNRWVVSSYQGSNKLFLCISMNDWNTLSSDTKLKMIDETISFLVETKESVGELFIYTSDNPGTKWSGYAKKSNTENIIRFDWKRSLFEEIMDKLNPLDDKDPV